MFGLLLKLFILNLSIRQMLNRERGWNTYIKEYHTTLNMSRLSIERVQNTATCI